MKPFILPDEKDPHGRSILGLAEQPLLLLMLALYDSDDNRLKKGQGIDRTVLYDSLLRRFVLRERKKRKDFDELKTAEQEGEVDRDIQRLGVAAIGMYNRRKLHILSSELEEDLKCFEMERQIVVENGRPLSQADMLLGSFFFVHKSKLREFSVSLRVGGRFSPGNGVSLRFGALRSARCAVAGRSRPC